MSQLPFKTSPTRMGSCIDSHVLTLLNKMGSLKGNIDTSLKPGNPS